MAVIPVVGIGKMRMGMDHRLMPVDVGMTGSRRHGKGMVVLMMGIVDVGMGMLQRPVAMRVVVALGQVQPHAPGPSPRAGSAFRRRKAWPCA